MEIGAFSKLPTTEYSANLQTGDISGLDSSLRCSHRAFDALPKLKNALGPGLPRPVYLAGLEQTLRETQMAAMQPTVLGK
jgi:hypothetical protein